ncbi:hypothetical protein [Subtercola lobariae]|uniref:Uncharacterized protein n=1 Tax=Subtercola lobariae TaxID=1588641 RepID=A0A917F0C7_9MICO|nr:hypothetical protein [Subtercola lobariae]GGF39605.1 hypothetical protein GCM10011399_35630 [Subtercola lobariae]
MEWWSNFLNWANTDGGAYVIVSIAVPAASIIVAGLLAAWIASGSIKRLLAGRDRELKVAAIGALVDAAEQASVWNSLTPQEQILSDRATGQADIQVRLLPIKGATLAANWAAYSLAEMKRNSATFGYQIEPAVVQFRDQLVEWQHKPSRSRRSFQADLDRWKAKSADSESTLRDQQEAWVAQQHHEQHAAPASAASQTAPDAVATHTPAPAVTPTVVTAPHYDSPTYSAPGALDTQRVLNDVDAVERQIEAGATR